MDLIKDGWFMETHSLWPGMAMCLKVDEILVHVKSPYQDILVFKSTNHGNVLVLDGIIQFTEADEFSYHETMSHVSMNSHPAPRKVLIVGGGDGGIAREVLKHPEVEEVILCEIDEKVVEVCKKYFPSLTSSAFSNPKLKIIFADGLEFIRTNTNRFDVIITDSSDNVGVATPLFGEEYYKLIKSALATGGVACSQGECFWLHSKFIAKMVTLCRDIFPVVDFAICSMPTYPSGEQGFLLCSLDPKTDFKIPLRKWGAKEVAEYNLRYYNSSVHRAALTPPEWFRSVLHGDHN